MEILSKQKKDEIWRVLKENSVSGTIVVSKVPLLLREKLRIEWKDYAEYQGPGGCKKWLCSEFPVQDDPENGYRLILDESSSVSAVPADKRKQIEGILIANLSEEGFLMNSAIPKILRDYGLDWKELAGGLGFEEWITREFPMFWIDKSGKAPCIRRGTVVRSAAEESEAYPVTIDINSPDSVSEVREMHQFAFMGWWANTAKLLRNLTGYKGNDENVWRGIIARQLAMAKLNLDRRSYFEALDDEQPRIAFHTGLKTADGKPLYGILMKNPRTEGPVQQWVFSCFCYPGQEGEGQWLCRRFNIPSEDESGYERTHDELLSRIQEIKELKEQLTGKMEELCESVAGGRTVSAEAVKGLNRYSELWSEILERLEKLNAQEALQNENLKIEELERYVSGNEVYYEMLFQSVDLFETMTKELYDWMKESHLISGEYESTSMYADSSRIAEKYRGKKNGTVDLTGFFDTLNDYKEVKFIADSAVLNDRVMDAVEKVSEHFKIPARAISLFMIGSGPVQTLDSLDGIVDLLRQCEMSEGTQGKEIQTADVEIEHPVGNELSASVKQVFSEEGISKDSLRSLFPQENEFEQMIITNRLKEAGKLCEDSEKMKAMGYSQEEIERINSILLYKNEMSGNLKEYFCACRLLEVQKNKNRQAEKYLLMADKTNDMVVKLLDIYRREERIEDFLFVCEKYCEDYNIDFTNKSFLIQIYSKYMMCDKLLVLVRKHPELTYDVENLTCITAVCKGSEESLPLAEQFAGRRERLKSQPVLNELEAALVNCDQPEISRLANDREALLELDYTEEEADTIYQSMMLGDYPEQTGNSWEFETGCRIYTFQKNKHALAEQYLWKGLMQSNLAVHCLKIFHILSEENRWEECRALYEAYEGKLKGVEDARKYYISALLHLDIQSACERVDSDLLDFLDEDIFALLHTSAVDEKSRNIAEQISGIMERIDNDYISSVVYIKPELREYIVHPERMEDYGITAEEAGTIVNIYKNDLFSYGTGALEIAQRVYAFWKNRNHLAETLAALALPKEEAAEFLLQIYSEENDYDKQAELFEQIPDLIQQRSMDYLRLLFYKERYEKFLHAYAQLAEEDKTALLKVEAFVAYVITGQEGTENLAENIRFLDEDMVRTEPWLAVRLMKALSEKQWYKVFARLLGEYFEVIADVCTPEQVKRFVTGDDTCDTDTLLQIQTGCKESGKDSLVLYLYNVLGIGQETELSERFFAENREAIESLEGEEKLSRIHFLDLIYPKMHRALYRMGLAAGLKNIADDERSGAEQKQEDIALFLQDMKMDADLFYEIADCFSENDYLDSTVIRQNLYQACKEGGCVDQVLELLSNYAVRKMEASRLSSDYCKFLCKKYCDAIRNNAFPEKIRAKAIYICRNYMEESENSEAAFCLYKLYQANNNRKMEQLALQYIMDCSPSELSTEIYEAVGEDVRNEGKNVTTRLFQIFKEELSVCKACEVRDFINEAKCFIRLSQPVLEFAKRLEEAESVTVYSEDESEYLLKLLFRNPDSPRFWAECVNLPFKSEPELYAKILYNVAKSGGGTWQECVEYCEKYELKQLMFDAIYQWLDSKQSWGEVIDCQKFLMKLSTVPGCLSEFDNKDLLREITERLCKTYYMDGMSDEMSHEALRSIAIVAVECGMEAILYQNLSDVMATKESYVGTVVISSLLLKGRPEYAHKLLQKMSVNINNCPFRPLIMKLSELTEEELEAEVQKPVLRNLLSLSLPKGNRPNIESVQEFILNALRERKTEEAAQTLNELLDIFRDDIIYYSGLFLLCKEPFEGCELYLQRGLYGLAILPQNNPKVAYVYQLKERPFKKWFCMITAVIRQKYHGQTLLPDFREDEALGTYYNNCNPMASTGEIVEMNSYYDQIRSLFDNRSEEEQKFLSRVILSCITGNWEEVLTAMYENQMDPEPYAEFFKVGNDGIVRCIIRMLKRLPEGEQDNFRDWVIRSLGRWIAYLSARLQLICDKEVLCTKEGIKAFRDLDLYLQYPLEEQFIFKAIYEKIIKTADSETAFDAYLTAGVLSMNNELAKCCFGDAMECFEAEDDERAYDLYRVSYMLGYRLKLFHIDDSRIFRYFLIMYQWRAAISGCFTDKRIFTSRVGSEQFPSWDCANMILQLLCTSRANEVERLKQYLSPKGRKLCDSIVTCVNSNLTDEYKISVMKRTDDLVDKFILCQILIFKKKGENCYLKEESSCASVRSYMEELADQTEGNEAFREGRLKVILNIPPRVHNAFYQQKEIREFAPLVQEEIAETPERELPSFAEQIEEEVSETDSLEALKEEYEHLPLEDKEGRKCLSAKLYQLSVKNGLSVDEVDDALVRYGIDCYRCDFDRQTMFELARYSTCMDQAGQGYREFREMGSSALFNILGEYRQITDLINSYKDNRDSFEILRGTLESGLARDIVKGFYVIIEELIAIYSSGAVSNNSALQAQLRMVYRKFEDIEYSREWSDIKNRLQMLINLEINNLSRCPILVCEVLNRGVNTVNGRIYGQISNVGREKAENVVVQAVINGEMHSAKYQLNMLYPENKAAFEIDYAVSEETEEIRYEIMISYVYKGESCSADSCRGSLALSEPQQYNLPDYNLGTIRAFAVDEKGEIISANDNILFGRSNEKNRISQTFHGDFSGYKDTLIRGVRRTGKTSLLNYMSVYISNFCPNVIPVYVDCQGATASQFIQSVFIDMVCEKLERNVAELTQSTAWMEFRKRWKLEENEPERNPRSLENFYWELSQHLEGRKLVLIFDEVDTLFEKVSQKQGLDMHLFPVLGAILCSMEMSEIVHFVFCGSNNLIKYSMDGGVLNQFFQRFSNVIEVGRLPLQDMNEMLQKSCGESSDLIYTKEALDWAWRLTGGLAWHAKALGQEVLKRARSENRNVIYPSDICMGINSIAADDYCRQFIEGCGQVECKVIDSFQSLVDHESEYVSREDIVLMLNGQYERGVIEQSLNLLVKLDILNKSILDGEEVYRYPFDLYRRYFQSRLPEEKRQQEADTMFRYVHIRKKKY